MKSSILALICLLVGFTVYAEDNKLVEPGFETLYRVTLLRAAPDKYAALLNEVGNRAKRRDYWVLRHSQGDHWDVMTIEPIGSYAQWFNPEKAPRQTLDKAWREYLDRFVAHRSEWFAYGPELSIVKQAHASTGLYHVEMFQAVAGQKIKLLQQRFNENRYLQQTGQVTNLVFKGDMGGDWDVMTIGFHSSLETFAKGSDLTPEQKDEIARANGFDGVSGIGSHLRSLIYRHNDTLAVPLN